MERSKLQFLTKAAVVHDALREEILAGDLAPGASLLQEEIAARLGVSPTPVREAFGLLEAEGLVQRRPHRGVVVAVARQLSSWEAEAIYKARHAIEEVAVRRLAAGEDPQLLAQLETVVQGADQARHAGDFVGYRQAMPRFHRELGLGTGSPELQAVMVQLVSQTQFFVASLTNDGLRRANRHHRAILAAVRSGDAEAALDAAQRHLDENLRDVRKLDGQAGSGGGRNARSPAYPPPDR